MVCIIFLLSIEFGGFGIPIIASHASPRNCVKQSFYGL
jgi:hypothetical protein